MKTIKRKNERKPRSNNKRHRKVTVEIGQNGIQIKTNGYHPRCINIDCAFNSSLQPTEERNICNHPNLKVSSNLAEVTVAICTEFRSKKDFKYKKPDKLIELRTKNIVDLGGGQAEFIAAEHESQPVETKFPAEENRGPVIIETGDGGDSRSSEEKAELYNLTDSRGSNFFILKLLYRPHMKRGIILSVVFHFLLIWLFYIAFVDKESRTEIPSEQRIVVVEDIETPKFIPPDLDKKEEPPGEVKSTDIKPKIIPKKITPRIRRPKTFLDTTSIVRNDTSKAVVDSALLSLYKGDTNRFILPDSLRNTFAENEVGMSLWYPKDWKLTDSRQINKGEQFSGVIINTDTLSEDPGGVTMFIILENDRVNSFNKTIFKNPFAMEDSLSTAFSTDPMPTGAKKISYKFYIFAPSNKIFVNTDVKRELFEKYRKYIEAIVRTIKIIKPGNP